MLFVFFFFFGSVQINVLVKCVFLAIYYDHLEFIWHLVLTTDIAYFMQFNMLLLQHQHKVVVVEDRYLEALAQP